MKALKNSVIALTLSILSLSMAHSTTPKLPFVGSVEVNFYGGNGTAKDITIKPNGTITITSESERGKPYTEYKGTFRNPLKVTDQYGNVDYYKFFGKQKIALVDENGNIRNDCNEEQACIELIDVYQ